MKSIWSEAASAMIGQPTRVVELTNAPDNWPPDWEGMAVKDDDGTPLIFLRASLERYDRMPTFLHEVGHHVRGRSEDEAEAFAEEMGARITEATWPGASELDDAKLFQWLQHEDPRELRSAVKSVAAGDPDPDDEGDVTAWVAATLEAHKRYLEYIVKQRSGKAMQRIPVMAGTKMLDPSKL